MILEEFDKNKKAVINPEDFHEKTVDFPKTCVSFFSKTVMEEFVKQFKPEIIGHVSNATLKFNIYKIKVGDVSVAVTHAPVGAPAAVANMEELISMGIENFVHVGCCGCLDGSIEDYSIIIPTAAIRDEGTSYHYAPATDIVELDKKCVDIIEYVIKMMDFHYVKGITWTTDAIFRETKDKVERRKSQGAITVDMECSALAVLAKFRGVNFAQVFYAADNLGEEQYDPRSLIGGEIEKKSVVIPIGIKCAIELYEKTKVG